MVLLISDPVRVVVIPVDEAVIDADAYQSIRDHSQDPSLVGHDHNFVIEECAAARMQGILFFVLVFLCAVD